MNTHLIRRRVVLLGPRPVHVVHHGQDAAVVANNVEIADVKDSLGAKLVVKRKSKSCFVYPVAIQEKLQLGLLRRHPVIAHLPFQLPLCVF